MDRPHRRSTECDYASAKRSCAGTRIGNRARAAAVGIVTAAPIATHASGLPDDVFSGAYGGAPSITANAELGVSITIPADAIDEAGGGTIMQIAKGFLDRFGPHICSGTFDFQSPHRGLKIAVAVTGRPKSLLDDVAEEISQVSAYREVTIDYEPRQKVTCVTPYDPTS